MSNSDHLFPVCQEGELMNEDSHCIFRDSELQCQWDVTGTRSPPSINLWTGGHEPQTPPDSLSIPSN